MSSNTTESEQVSYENPIICGPALPPHLQKAQQKTFGPSLPTNYDSIAQERVHIDDDSDNIIGPLPINAALSTTHLALEERALEMKLAKLDNSEDNSKVTEKREEWMLKLPAIKAIGSEGVTKRQFQTKERPDFSDRSNWTDTPQSKLERKEKPNVAEQEKSIKDQAELLFIKKRDKEQEKLISKHKKKHKRDKSLIEIHKKKREKEKKKESKNLERRPFSRDVDLQANRFDAARTDSAIKKAALLDTKFSSGCSKFL